MKQSVEMEDETVLKHLQHPCFTGNPASNYSVSLLPHRSGDQNGLECIHYPYENSKHLPILFIHGAFHGAWCFGLMQEDLQVNNIDNKLFIHQDETDHLYRREGSNHTR